MDALDCARANVDPNVRARARARRVRAGRDTQIFQVQYLLLVPVALRSRQMILSNSSHCLRVTPQATP